MTSTTSTRKSYPRITARGRATPRKTDRPDIRHRKQTQAYQARCFVRDAVSANPVVRTERSSVLDMQNLLTDDCADAIQCAARLVSAIALHCQEFKTSRQCDQKLRKAQDALKAALRPGLPASGLTLTFAIQQAERALNWVARYLAFDWEANKHATPARPPCGSDPREPRSNLSWELRRFLAQRSFVPPHRKPCNHPALESLYQRSQDFVCLAIWKELPFDGAYIELQPVLDDVRDALSEVPNQADQFGELDLLDKLFSGLVVGATEPVKDVRQEDLLTKLDALSSSLGRIDSQRR